MTLFNFQPDFVDKIRKGEKLSTIRKTKRCKVGDTMQLYTGLRTKSCKKIMDVECIGVAPIIISAHSIWKLGDTEGNINPGVAPLHEQEGFLNAQDFVEFFRKKYGLPFRGFIHAWRVK